MFYRAPQLFHAVSLCSAHTESFPSFNHSSRRWMAITTAQTGELDQSFKPTDYLTTAGEKSHCTARVNDECVWKQIFCLFFCLLQINGEEEQRRFEEGNARYLHNKAKRLAEKQQQWRRCSLELNACNSSTSTPPHTYSMRGMKTLSPAL